MKIKTKLTIFLVIYLVVLVSALGGIFINVAMRGYQTLENQSFEQNKGRMTAGLDALIHKTDGLLRDWVSWDDLYAYVNDPNLTFEKSSIGPTFLSEQDIDYIMIFNASDELVYGLRRTGENRAERVNAGAMGEYLLANKNSQGLMLIDGRPLAYSAAEVTTTEQDAPKTGLLCFGFYVTQQQLDRINEDKEIDLRIASVMERYDPTGDLILEYEHEDYRTALYKLPYVNDPHGLAIQLTHPLEITRLGVRTLVEVFAVTLLVFVTLSLMLFLIVRHFVIRLRRLSLRVNEIAHNQDLKKRVEIDSKDELADLTGDINFMLDRIEQMNNQLTEHATVDMLTGVLNRRVGLDHLKRLINEVPRGSGPLTICYIDINNLKVINDSMGHKFGDDLIVTVAQTIRRHIREQDIIFRLGGDEFLVIFRGCDLNSAKSVFGRIEKALAQINDRGEKPYPISISRGFYTYDGVLEMHDFIEEADREMYVDKAARKSS